MRSLISIFAFLLISETLHAQVSVDFRYQFFQNTQVNRSIEAFNLAHAYTGKGLHYLHHGYAASLGKMFKISQPRSLFFKLDLPYQRLDQRFVTPDVTQRITHEQLGITGELIFHPKALKGKMSTGPLGTRLYYVMGAGYAYSRSSVRKDGALLYRSQLQGSPTFVFGMGQRRSMIRSRIVVSPFFKLYASPWRNIGDYQKAILGTALNPPTGGHIVWQANAGVEFTWLKKEKKRSGFLRQLFHKKVKSATEI
jgi:hypothetical protein